MPRRTLTPSKIADSRWPQVALVAMVLLGIAARASLHFRSPLVPGINGGYYLVQARAVLEHGWLGIPDLPLTFVLHATLAKIIQLVHGGTLEECIVLAVKSADSVLPPLAAVPVFMLGMAWSRRLGRGGWIVPLVAGLLAMGMPGLSITGEFEKNALGLVWLAGLIWALHGWLEHSDKRHALRVLLFLGLVGVTHIGVFGAALLFTALTLAVSLVQHPGLLAKRSTWVVAGSAVAVVGLAAGLVAWKFDPTRIERLWQAVSEPTEFLQTGGPGRPPAGAIPPQGAMPRGGPGMAPVGMGPGGPGGMPGGPGMGREREPMIFFGLLTIPALLVAVWKQRSWDKGTIAVVIGAALTAIAMTGPWVGGDKTMRFPLIAIVPALVAALFTLIHAPRVWIGAPLTALLVAALCVPSLRLVCDGSHASISVAAYDELREIAKGVKEPDKTIVIARHGLEWWTAWTMRTSIAQSRAMEEEDWQKYKFVWMLQERQSSGMPGGAWHFSFADVLGRPPMPPGGRPGMGGPPGMGPGAPQGPPPGMGDMFGIGFPRPGPTQGPMPRQGFGGPRMMGGPFGNEPMPEEAEIQFEGRYFTLGWLREPPLFVMRRGGPGR